MSSNIILFCMSYLFTYAHTHTAPVICSYFKEQATSKIFQSSTFSLSSNVERPHVAEDADDYFFVVSV